MEPNARQIERRVRRYWYEDGFAEIVGGGTFLLLGLYFGIQEYLGPDSLLTTILQVSMVLLFIGGAILARRLMIALKTRVTYPRTGYVEYSAAEGPNPRMRMRGIVVLAVGMLVAVSAVVIARLLGSPDLIVAMSGILFGAILAATAGRSTGLARFYVLGALSFALGVALSYAGLPQGYALGLFYGLMGVAAIASGGWTLAGYLHQNPLPAEAGDER